MKGSEICAKCGGECCKRCPGATHPRQWQPNMEKKIRAALESGKWTIDWWEGDPRPRGARSSHVSTAPYLRPAIKRHEGKTRHPTWEGGECAFLTKRGCKLSKHKRPRECRSLRASPYEGDCHGKWKKQDAAVAWLPHSHLLNRIGDEVEEGKRKPLTSTTECGM